MGGEAEFCIYGISLKNSSYLSIKQKSSKQSEHRLYEWKEWV